MPLKLEVWLSGQQTKQSLVRLMKSSTFGQGLSRSESDQEMLDKLFFSYQPKAGCIYPGILCKYFVVLCRSLQGVAYHQQLINGCCSTFRENFCVCFELWCNLFNYLFKKKKQSHWFLIRLLSTRQTLQRRRFHSLNRALPRPMFTIYWIAFRAVTLITLVYCWRWAWAIELSKDGFYRLQ